MQNKIAILFLTIFLTGCFTTQVSPFSGALLKSADIEGAWEYQDPESEEVIFFAEVNEDLVSIYDSERQLLFKAPIKVLLVDNFKLIEVNFTSIYIEECVDEDCKLIMRDMDSHYLYLNLLRSSNEKLVVEINNHQAMENNSVFDGLVSMKEPVEGKYISMKYFDIYEFRSELSTSEILRTIFENKVSSDGAIELKKSSALNK